MARTRTPQEQEELLGIAAHDIRGVLANVRTYAGLLMSKRFAPLDPKVQRSVEVILRNADRALRLVQCYFDSIRAETGFFSVHSEKAPLEATVAEVIASRAPLATEKNLTILNRVERLPEARFDRERGASAIAAFLDNALEREPENGQVEIRCVEGDSNLTLEFVDHGPSVDPDEAAQLFDREEQALRNKKLGYGFGMAVGRAIARTLGENAGYRNAQGETVFAIGFPRAVSRSVEEAAAP